MKPFLFGSKSSRNRYRKSPTKSHSEIAVETVKYEINGGEVQPINFGEAKTFKGEMNYFEGYSIHQKSKVSTLSKENMGKMSDRLKYFGALNNEAK